MFGLFNKSGPQGDRTVYANNPEGNAAFEGNAVTNTKYTLLNFVPKNLAEQFRCARGCCGEGNRS
jgi:hypothetical protein